MTVELPVYFPSLPLRAGSCKGEGQGEGSAFPYKSRSFAVQNHNNVFEPAEIRGGFDFDVLIQSRLRIELRVDDCADQNSFATHLIHDQISFVGRGLKRTAIFYQFNSDKESGTTHVAHQREPVLQFAQAAKYLLTNVQRVALQIFFNHHAQHCQSNSRRYGVSAERAEEFHAVIKRSGDVARGNDRADGVAACVGEGVYATD